MISIPLSLCTVSTLAWLWAVVQGVLLAWLVWWYWHGASGQLALALHEHVPPLPWSPQHPPVFYCPLTAASREECPGVCVCVCVCVVYMYIHAGFTAMDAQNLLMCMTCYKVTHALTRPPCARAYIRFRGQSILLNKP